MLNKTVIIAIWFTVNVSFSLKTKNIFNITIGAIDPIYAIGVAFTLLNTKYL